MEDIKKKSPKFLAMPSLQKNIIILLSLLLLISVLVLQFDIFLVNNLTIFAFKALVIVFFVLFAFFLSKITSIKAYWFFVLFILIEIIFWGLFTVYYYTGKGYRIVLDYRNSQNPINHFQSINFDKKLARYDSILFYTLKQGEGQHRDFEFSNQYFINSAGLRDDESSLKTPEIIVLGDSHSMGLGVEQNQSFPQLLETHLKRKVLNTGISSYGTVREKLLLKRLDLSKTKLLIVQYCENDFGENRAFFLNQFQISSKAEYYKNQCRNEINGHYFPLKFVLIQVQYIFLKAKAVFETSSNVQIGSKNAGLFETRLLDSVTPALAFVNALNTIKQVYHGNIIVINLNFGDEPQNSIDDIATEIKNKKINNTYTLNVRPLLNKEDYYKLDGHEKASGHEKIASALKTFITSNDFFSEQ